MARDRADHRRLKVADAVVTALGGMPAAWTGAWGVLALLSILIAVPAVVPLEDWLGRAHAVVLGLAGLSAWTGLTRIAVGGGAGPARRLGLGAGGLQFGKAELRVAGGLALILLFLTIVGAVLGLVILAAAGAAHLDLTSLSMRHWAILGPSWTLALPAGVAVVLLGLMTLLITRLSLFAPASVGRGQTVSLNSMGIAHDAFWPLLAVWLIVAATAAVLPLADAQGWLAWPKSRLIAAAALPWLWAPFAANLLAAAYGQLEYWTPGEGKP